MKSVRRLERVGAALGGVALLAAAAIWLLPAPPAMASTYMVVLSLVLAVVAVTMMSWRNALPTDTIAQVLYRTENDRIRDGRAR